MKKIFGSRSERLVKAYRRRVEQINTLEPDIRKLTDAELRGRTDKFRQRISQGERVAQLIPEILATAREAMDRSVGIRNILNPEHKFDASKLPASLQPVYAKLAAEAAALEPQAVLGGEPAPGWMQVDIPNELYNAVRDLHPHSKPPFRARPFDVQLIGGMVLSEGRIAEMKTGEGKTIVAPLACYIAALEQLQCYVVTVNDYLVQRDRDWVFPFYYHLGLTVGTIHPHHMQPHEKKAEAYDCNVVYGTNSEFGFDYLRDNMKLSAAEQVQKRRDFCIIDEVDSILIDEARTPLIISGPAHEDAPRYALADNVARHLMQKQREWDAADKTVQHTIMHIKGLEGDIRQAREKAKVPALRDEMKKLMEQLPNLEAQRDQHTQYYELEREKKASHLTHDGVAEAQRVAGIGSFYVGNNMDFPHLLENALRAHAVYQRDRDYVVQGDEVVIVDEFTGRLMIGRQWSDGLHQAVEAKERVKIKEETQTLATVTIQNFFKLFKRLAGMTGTAATEATEFGDIYRLEVVSIPTNVPVIRRDYNDLVFLSRKDKWTAILDEIERMHDLGRPVLVGTTSVENSEMLSQMLSKRHAIQHEVLNAKQHEREAQIVEHAGELGAVMIATNMAGRGTDIKLARIDRAAVVRHWQQRNLLPKQAKPELSDDELIALAYRHLASRELGIKPKDVDALADEDIRLRLARHWVSQYTYADPAKAQNFPLPQCEALLDKAANFLFHRLAIYTNVEQMGGLHIIGTERHEARRIDNQLRGRAGRQGDRGSSRFFISLEDDLMQLFANKTVLNMLAKLGMKEGDAIEHRMVTRSVERAQRKVEERNYEIRKNLLEYDEVMEHQRNAFYGIRQEVLEGRHIDQIIFDYIADATEDAVATYVDRDYVPTQIAEWCRQTLDVSIEPGKLYTDNLSELQEQVRREARIEAASIVDVTIGEYMSNDVPAEEWDLRSLSQWAMSRFHVDLKQNQLRRMTVDQVQSQLVEAAAEQIEKKDLSDLGRFLAPHYAQQQLADWAENQFGLTIDVGELAELEPDVVSEWILKKARHAYHRREIEYPVDFVLDMAFQAAQQDGSWAAQQLCGWSNARYEMGWTPETLINTPREQLRTELVAASQAWWDDGKLEACVDKALAEHTDRQALAEWATQRFGGEIDANELAGDNGEAGGPRDVLLARGRQMLRAELAQLERFVLLQILDAAWKDHLYSMDQLKDSVGLRGYAEQDPRIEYKREGAKQFTQMQKLVRDRVTGLIFRARLTANVEARSVYHDTEARHDAASSAVQRASGAASAGTQEQRADLAAAEQAGSRDARQFMSRKQRRAAARESKGSTNRPDKRRKRRR